MTAHQPTQRFLCERLLVGGWWLVGEAYGAGQDDNDAEQRRAPGEDVVEEVPLAYDM